MSFITRNIKRQTEKTLSFLNQKVDHIDVTEPPPLDDFDQKQRVSVFAWLSNGVRVGNTFSSIGKPPNPTDEEIRRSIAFGVGLAYRPDREYINFAIGATSLAKEGFEHPLQLTASMTIRAECLKIYREDIDAFQKGKKLKDIQKKINELIDLKTMTEEIYEEMMEEDYE